MNEDLYFEFELRVKIFQKVFTKNENLLLNLQSYGIFHFDFVGWQMLTSLILKHKLWLLNLTKLLQKLNLKCRSFCYLNKSRCFFPLITFENDCLEYKFIRRSKNYNAIKIHSIETKLPFKMVESFCPRTFVFAAGVVRLFFQK